MLCHWQNIKCPTNSTHTVALRKENAFSHWLPIFHRRDWVNSVSKPLYESCKTKFPWVNTNTNQSRKTHKETATKGKQQIVRGGLETNRVQALNKDNHCGISGADLSKHPDWVLEFSTCTIYFAIQWSVTQPALVTRQVSRIGRSRLRGGRGAASKYHGEGREGETVRCWINCILSWE